MSKIKNQKCYDRTDSVYPISVLHAPYRTCKTENSSPMNLLGGVCGKDSLNFFMFLKKFH